MWADSGVVMVGYFLFDLYCGLLGVVFVCYGLCFRGFELYCLVLGFVVRVVLGVTV